MAGGGSEGLQENSRTLQAVQECNVQSVRSIMTEQTRGKLECCPVKSQQMYDEGRIKTAMESTPASPSTPQLLFDRRRRGHFRYGDIARLSLHPHEMRARSFHIFQRP